MDVLGAAWAGGRCPCCGRGDTGWDLRSFNPTLARVYCRNLLTLGLGPLCALPSLPSCPVCAALGFGLSQIPGTFALPCAPPRDAGAVPHTLGCLCPVCTCCLCGTHESFHLPFYTTDDNLLLAGLTPVLQEMRARVKILPWSFYSKCWKSLLSSPAFPSCMGAHSNCALLINASFYNLYLIDTENGGGSP